MKLESQHISKLTYKYLTNSLTEDEEIELDKWLENPYNELQFKNLIDEKDMAKGILANKKIDSDKLWKKLSKKTVKKFRFRRVLEYAAVILPIVFIGSITAYIALKEIPKINTQTSELSIIPTKAILTLEDGTCHNLINSDTMIRTSQTNINIKGNSILYKNDISKITAEIHYNSVDIPKGMQYNLTLNDGTKVWLNADTKFKYPVIFCENKREVFIESGEVLFQVSKNKNRPFIVHFNDHKVQVLGTMFNVKSYNNTKSYKVTLAEGSVLIDGDTKLKPDEQAIIIRSENSINVRKVNSEIVCSWKDKLFMYKNERLDVIMDDLSRFYDIHVFYRNQKVKEKRFSLSLKQDDSFQSILKLIGLTNRARFEISSNNVIVQ